MITSIVSFLQSHQGAEHLDAAEEDAAAEEEDAEEEAVGRTLSTSTFKDPLH